VFNKSIFTFLAENVAPIPCGRYLAGDKPHAQLFQLFRVRGG